jgi:hypothetical protein
VINILSLGAGVQSTTMALMAAHGEIKPMPDAAIFADTQSEPQTVYEHLEWLRSGNVLPFPVHTVTKGSLRNSVTQGVAENRFVSAPFFTSAGNSGGGILRRQCTREYKIDPLNKEMRRLAGYEPRQRIPENTVECWIGISLDEVIRMKDSRVRWVKNRWPLVEKEMSRHDCLLWLDRNGYPKPPKSSCTFCPYHSDEMWRELRDNDHASWADAVEVDAAIRDSTTSGVERQVFLHRSLKPLPEVDLTTLEDQGQLNMFNNECEGMCGV